MAAADMPQSHELLWPTLQAVNELGGSATIGEILETIIERQGLSKSQQTVLHNNGPKTEIGYRLAWTRSYLKRIGLLTNTARGVWALTDEGAGLVADPSVSDSQRYERIHQLWQTYQLELRKTRKIRSSESAVNPYGAAGQGGTGIDRLGAHNGNEPHDIEPNGVRRSQVNGSAGKRRHWWPLKILILILVLISIAFSYLGVRWRPTGILQASSVVNEALSSNPAIAELDLSTSVPVPARATLIAEPKKILTSEIFHARDVLLLSFDIPRATVLQWAVRIWANPHSAPRIVAFPQPPGTHLTALRPEGDFGSFDTQNPDGSTKTASYVDYVLSGTIIGPAKGYELSANLFSSLRSEFAGVNRARLPRRQPFQVILPLEWRGDGIVSASKLDVGVQAPDLHSTPLTTDPQFPANDRPQSRSTPISWRSAPHPFHWQIAALMSEPVQEIYGPPNTYNDGFDWFFDDKVSRDQQVDFYGVNAFAGDVLSGNAFLSGLAFGIAGTAFVAALQTGATLLFERRRRDNETRGSGAS